MEVKRYSHVDCNSQRLCVLLVIPTMQSHFSWSSRYSQKPPGRTKAFPLEQPGQPSELHVYSPHWIQETLLYITSLISNGPLAPFTLRAMILSCCKLMNVLEKSMICPSLFIRVQSSEIVRPKGRCCRAFKERRSA